MNCSLSYFSQFVFKAPPPPWAEKTKLQKCNMLSAKEALKNKRIEATFWSQYYYVSYKTRSSFLGLFTRGSVIRHRPRTEAAGDEPALQ